MIPKIEYVSYDARALLWSDAMNNRTLSTKPQMNERRSSTIGMCGRRAAWLLLGDDLVLKSTWAWANRFHRAAKIEFLVCQCAARYPFIHYIIYRSSSTNKSSSSPAANKRQSSSSSPVTMATTTHNGCAGDSATADRVVTSSVGGANDQQPASDMNNVDRDIVELLKTEGSWSPWRRWLMMMSEEEEEDWLETVDSHQRLSGVIISHSAHTAHWL